jgi:23S rRNA G2069 N7-methylase RlmK/C1962 C5-methylase RlmI
MRNRPMKKTVLNLIFSFFAVSALQAQSVEMRPVMTLDLAKKWLSLAKKKPFKKAGN